MSKFLIEEESPGGHYHLLKDGEELLQGTWAACFAKALFLGKDGEDVLTSGYRSVNVPIEEERRLRKERARAAGLFTDEYGRLSIENDS